MKKALILIAVVGLFGISAMRCASGSSGWGGTKLQQQWTKDTRVSYYNGGGMVNESRRLDITSDSAVYEMHENNVTERYKLTYTKEELDQIAKMFYDHRFDQLKPVKTELVYDAPSTDVQMCIGAECFNQGNSATETYTGRDQEHLRAIIDFLLQNANKKLEAIKVPLTIVIDDELLKGEENVHYQMTGNISFGTDYNGRNDKTEYKVLPGNIEMYVNTMSKDSSGNTVYLLNANKTFNTKDGNIVIISKKKDGLDVELKNIKK